MKSIILLSLFLVPIVFLSGCTKTEIIEQKGCDSLENCNCIHHETIQKEETYTSTELNCDRKNDCTCLHFSEDCHDETYIKELKGCDELSECYKCIHKPFLGSCDTCECRREVCEDGSCDTCECIKYINTEGECDRCSCEKGVFG